MLGCHEPPRIKGSDVSIPETKDSSMYVVTVIGSSVRSQKGEFCCDLRVKRMLEPFSTMNSEHQTIKLATWSPSYAGAFYLPTLSFDRP